MPLTSSWRNIYPHEIIWKKCFSHWDHPGGPFTLPRSSKRNIQQTPHLPARLTISRQSHTRVAPDPAWPRSGYSSSELFWSFHMGAAWSRSIRKARFMLSSCETSKAKSNKTFSVWPFLISDSFGPTWRSSLRCWQAVTPRNKKKIK